MNRENKLKMQSTIKINKVTHWVTFYNSQKLKTPEALENQGF